jgi:hypothetical protein
MSIQLGGFNLARIGLVEARARYGLGVICISRSRYLGLDDLLRQYR